MSGHIPLCCKDSASLPLTTILPPEGRFLCVFTDTAGFLGVGGTSAGGVGGMHGTTGGVIGFGPITLCVDNLGDRHPIGPVGAGEEGAV